MRKVTVWVILLSVSLSLVVYSVPPGKSGKSFIWEIRDKSGEGGNAGGYVSGYILGTIYFCKKEFYPLSLAIENAFAQSQVLLVEVNMSNENMAKVFKMINEKTTYTGSETLKSNISEAAYEKLMVRFKEKGMDIGGFNKVKPLLVAEILYGMILEEMGYSRGLGIDKYLMDKVMGKKEIVELESLEFKLSIFDRVTREEEEAFLLEVLKPVASIESDISLMVNTWLKGDLGEMERLVEELNNRDPLLKKVYSFLLEERNKLMVVKIDRYLKQGKKVMIIIGAAHLVGKTGLLQLLKDKGYTLTQL